MTKYTMTLSQVRQVAMSFLPRDVANDTCVQDSLKRLREDLEIIDGNHLNPEDQPAPEYLVKRVFQLWNWIIVSRGYPTYFEV